MKLSSYLKDKIIIISLLLISYLIILSMLIVFKIDKSLIIAITLTIFITIILIFTIEFIRKKLFYDDFLNKLNSLDKKYLITELLKDANFYEAEILKNSLYEIDKSMNEKINEYKISFNDFKEYIEMWIHEVKLPISSLILINHNSTQNNKINYQIKKIEDYVEQILFYVRSENASKDYLITKCNLNKIINNVLLKNKDELLYKNIDIKLENINTYVYTDSKWLEFIINQIISNSIKYSKENPYIKFSIKEINKTKILSIYDNGIGICKSDINRVFDKTFTGKNGRKIKSSTGMGLFICKNLCNKLGHKINIKSEEGKYTEVQIEFYDNDFYNVR